MPTIGWFEILIVVGIAIIVLGPKDFPIMLKKAGSWIGTAKKYMRDIQSEVSNIEIVICDYTIPDYAQILLMSLCNHNIIANSTFSWWSSWLGNSKNVIAPRKWFSGDCIRHDTKDLYLPHWKIL